MNDNPEREEPVYIRDQQPSEQHIAPDVAQNPDEIARKQLPQVPVGQESEPSRVIHRRLIGKPRRKTIGTVTQDEKKFRAQDPFRVDITLFEDESTGQMQFERTSDVLGRFQQTGVRATDCKEIPLESAEKIDPSDVSGPQLDTVRKQEGGASRKHTRVNNPGSKIVPD